MANKSQEAIEALEKVEVCIGEILDLAYNNGVTSLARFKFNDQTETIRAALEMKEVDVETLKLQRKDFEPMGQGDSGFAAWRAIGWNDCLDRLKKDYIIMEKDNG